MNEQAEKAEKQPHPTNPYRNADGTLKAGHPRLNATGGGRRRTKYIVELEAACSPADFRAVVWIAKLDAQGRRPVINTTGQWTGQAEPDPNSNAIGRNAARAWLSKTIGLAGIDDDTNGGFSADVYAEYDDLTDEQSAAIRERIRAETAELEAELARIQDNGESAGVGISGADADSSPNAT